MDTPCTGPSCTRPAHSKGLCTTHYGQQHRGASLTVLGGKPVVYPPCALSTCEREGRITGYCNNHIVTKRRYRLTSERFEALMTRESCDICGARRTDQRLAIDHDHEHCGPGRGCMRCVRGVLCYSCNVTIAHIKDQNWLKGIEDRDWGPELDWLRRAANYINEIGDSMPVKHDISRLIS